MKISAGHGSKDAQSAIEQHKDKNKEVLKSLIEFLAISLQAELERVSSFMLGQLQTKEIGLQLNNLIEHNINKILYLIDIEKEFGPYLEDFLSEMMNYFESKININDKTKWILQQISELNLILDFTQIADNLKCLELIEKDRILTYLVMLNVRRRSSRRQFLTK
jgi:hypothetical protein